MSDNESINTSQFLFYASNSGDVKVQVIVENETVWATQASIAEIFDTSKQSISYHLTNIFNEGELDKKATVKEILTVQQEGIRSVRRKIEFYNLDAIISVGYRVNSVQATQFRIWANSVLKEYLVKGFALNDDRLKQGSQLFGKDYFDELIERIREIRASERRFYQKITDLYSQISIDYDANSPITREFYASVQNKFHFAIHSNTAAELISDRADSTKPNMGLTSWKNEKRGGKILKSDVCVAKNYLSEKEIKDLNLLVDQYLSYAEGLARRHIALTMAEWIKKLDAFLEFNEYPILSNAGKISAEKAKKIAEQEFEQFRTIQDKTYKSDFDKIIEHVKSEGKLPKSPK